MVHKTEQSDQAPNDEKPEICYCSALPKGSGPCLPCYARWLRRSAQGGATRNEWYDAPKGTPGHHGVEPLQSRIDPVAVRDA
jgi:hypothetical protein